MTFYSSARRRATGPADFSIEMRLSLLTLLCLLTYCRRGAAEVRLPHALSDHAVLQRDRPIHLWGWTSPGARLTAHFHGQDVAAIADPLGKWSLYLKPEAAGGPYVLAISGDGPEKRVDDLLVGDVWIASGQSNMEMPLNGFPPTASVKDAEKEIQNARTFYSCSSLKLIGGRRRATAGSSTSLRFAQNDNRFSGDVQSVS